jgi:hypothetical protein
VIWVFKELVAQIPRFDGEEVGFIAWLIRALSGVEQPEEGSGTGVNRSIRRKG